MAASPLSMPVLFVGHGSPMNAIEDNEFSRSWRDLGRSLPRPRAILCISAHWETPGVAVTSVSHPPTIHDFGGFPQPLFEALYPAPGEPALAQRVASLLAPEPVRLDSSKGLDHGTWSVLLPMYPKADIPVVQLSLDTRRPGSWHLALARKLAPLREEGVLILGSGNIVHNLGTFQFHDPASPPWVPRFAHRVNECILTGDQESLANPSRWGHEASLAIPTPEHYLPLLYAVAQREPGEVVTLFNDVTFSTLSMTSVALGIRPG